MPKVSQLLADRADCDVQFPADSVHVVYRPSAYTREFEAQLSALSEGATDEEARDYCDRTLADLIVEWDLTDDDDEPIPPVRGEIGARVPVAFLVMFVLKLVQAIAGELTAGPETRPTAQPTPLPNRAERRAASRR